MALRTPENPRSTQALEFPRDRKRMLDFLDWVLFGRESGVLDPEYQDRLINVLHEVLRAEAKNIIGSQLGTVEIPLGTESWPASFREPHRGIRLVGVSITDPRYEISTEEFWSSDIKQPRRVRLLFDGDVGGKDVVWYLQSKDYLPVGRYVLKIFDRYSTQGDLFNLTKIDGKENAWRLEPLKPFP